MSPSVIDQFPPNATIPFWRTEIHELDNHRSTENLPQEVDVVVIGAGYAGVSTVYHLLSSPQQAEGEKDIPPPPSVVILEARQISSGATGRNGGHIKPDVYFNLLKYAQKFGLEEAAEFARFEAANVIAVKALVDREGIDCDFLLTRAVDVYLDQGQAEEVERNWRELKALGRASLSDVQFIGGKDAERVSGVRGARCCFSFTAASLWPYKLIIHLLAELIKKGVNVQTNTPVTSVSDTPDKDGRWTVTTDRGSIKAKKIVYATNGYTAAILPDFSQKIVPVRAICSRIVSPKGTLSPFLSNTYSIRYGPSQADYLIPRPDGSIVVGGAKQCYWSDKPHWYNVTDDSKLIEPAARYFDGLMQRRFIGWEDSDAYTDAVWTGIQGWSSDFMPYVGELPDRPPGQMVIAGFSGHGMPIIYLAAKELADMLRDGRSFEQTTLPKVFKPSKERLASQTNEILGL